MANFPLRLPRFLLLPFLLTGVLALMLVSCQGAESAPIDRTGYATLFVARDMDLLTAVDQIEDAEQVAAAPWLLWVKRNESRNLPERSRAAAALSRMGFAEGDEFCLAILGAWLPGHEDESRQQAIPRSERMAFAREIAWLALQDRIRQANKPLPRYDVNQGAPQMAVAVEAIANQLSGIPHPPQSTAEIRRLYPKLPPQEWKRSSQSWSQARTALRDGAGRSSAGTESSRERGSRH